MEKYLTEIEKDKGIKILPEFSATSGWKISS
jgi:hypothetical protein